MCVQVYYSLWKIRIIPANAKVKKKEKERKGKKNEIYRWLYSPRVQPLQLQFSFQLEQQIPQRGSWWHIRQAWPRGQWWCLTWWCSFFPKWNGSWKQHRTYSLCWLVLKLEVRETKEPWINNRLHGTYSIHLGGYTSCPPLPNLPVSVTILHGSPLMLAILMPA